MESSPIIPTQNMWHDKCAEFLTKLKQGDSPFKIRV